MSGWISDELDFSARLKGVGISGRYAHSHGLSYRDFLLPEKAERAVTELRIKAYLPSDARLVRVCIPVNQDAILLYFISALFDEIESHGDIPAIALEDLISEHR